MSECECLYCGTKIIIEPIKLDFCTIECGLKFEIKIIGEENADLCAKLEMSERHKQLFCDEMNVYKKGCSVVEKERDELSAKIGQLESQVAVMRGALEEIQATINELGNDVLHNKSNGGWMLLNINTILDKTLSIMPSERGV